MTISQNVKNVTIGQSKQIKSQTSALLTCRIYEITKIIGIDSKVVISYTMIYGIHQSDQVLPIYTLMEGYKACKLS